MHHQGVGTEVSVDGSGIAEVVMDHPPVNALTVAGWFELADVVRRHHAVPLRAALGGEVDLGAGVVGRLLGGRRCGQRQQRHADGGSSCYHLPRTPHATWTLPLAG